MKTEQILTKRLLSQGRSKEVTDFLELSENEHTTYSKLWDTMKTGLRIYSRTPGARRDQGAYSSLTLVFLIYVMVQ